MALEPRLGERAEGPLEEAAGPAESRGVSCRGVPVDRVYDDDYVHVGVADLGGNADVERTVRPRMGAYGNWFQRQDTPPSANAYYSTLR